MSKAVPGRIVVSLLVSLSFGCGHGASPAALAQGTNRDEAKSNTAAGTSLMHGTPLFLVASSATVSEAGELWIPFRSGTSLPGEAVSELGVSFDPLFLRIGGEQWSLLPERERENSGAFGIRTRLSAEQNGDAMIGFSTRPRTVTTKKDATTLRIHRHVKLLFHASRKAGQAPYASAALTARFGLQMEFVPLIDPLPLEVGAELPMRLRFDGPGLSRTLVQVQFLAAGDGQSSVHVHRRYSDQDGHFVLPIHAAGTWRLMATHQVQAKDGTIDRHFAEIVFRTGAK